MNKLHELSNEELSQKIDQQVDLIYQTSQTGEFSAKHIDDFDLLAREFFARFSQCRSISCGSIRKVIE